MSKLSDIDAMKLTVFAAQPDIKRWLGDGSPFTDEEIRGAMYIAFTSAQDAFERGKVLEQFFWPVDEDLIVILMACARTFNAVKEQDFGHMDVESIIEHAKRGEPPPPPPPAKPEISVEGNITFIHFTKE